MNHLKKIIAVLMCGTLLTASAVMMNAEAATFEQINKEEVFINQNTDVTCTLASNVMMLRRAAILLGDPNWMSITENKCRYDSSMSEDGMWNGGMVFDYVFLGTTQKVRVSNPRVDQLTNDTSNSGRKKLFIKILKDHPEGVVIYSYRNPMHAILLTDYDADTDTFYCSDPNIGTPTKRVPMSQSNVNIYNVTSIWWIVSPELHFTSGSTATSTAKPTEVNETWKVTVDVGLRLREGHGTKYEQIGYVPCGAVVNVTKRIVSGGYTWGYVKYDSVNGWIALEYAEKTESKKAEPAQEVKKAETDNAVRAFDNLSSLSAESIVLGEKMTVYGKADKGTAPYTYAYYYKRSYSSTWTTIENFGLSEKASVEPMTATDYDVCVKIKDAKGNIEKKYMKFEVKKPLTNKSSVVSDIVYLGDDINIKGKATGGIGSYSYEYLYRRVEDDSWVKLQTASGDTASFRPLKATTYEVCVKVKDEKGHMSRIYQKINVCPKLVNNSKISADHVRVGDSVKLTAAAQGGEGSYQYAFYFKSEESTGWKTLNDFSRCQVAAFIASKATTYDVCVKVRDFYGKVEKKYFKVYVRK